MDFDLGIDGLLEPESKLIGELCESLEADGIHLTEEILSQIVQSYENYKMNYFKDLIESVMGPEELERLGGPAVIQVVMDPKKSSQKEANPLDDVDTDYLA